MATDNTPDTPAAAAAPAAAPKPARNIAAVLALLALLVALVTAGYVVYRDPPWGRLGKYNFSSPEQALRSEARMQANGDILALIEQNVKRDQKRLKEKLNSLEVKRVAEFEGKTALFIQYKMTDRNAKEPAEPKEHKDVLWYEQENGAWQQTGQPRTLQKGDPQLAKDVDAWIGSSNFGMPPGFGD